MSVVNDDIQRRPRRRVVRTNNQSNNPQYFVPVHPFASHDGPYTKPGYFLIPGSVNPAKMPLKQWLHVGRASHWIVLSIGILAVFGVMMALSMIQTPWKKETTNQTTSQTTHVRMSSGNDDLLEIHMRLRELVELKPVVETMPAPVINNLNDHSLNRLPVELAWQRSDESIHQAIFNQSDLHSILHGIDDHDDQSVYQSINQGWVLLFHGCSHQAIDWFTLPEERKVVRYMLSLGLSVLAFSSANTDSGCWDSTFAPSSTSQSNDQASTHANVDAVRVLSAFKQFAAREFDSVHKHDLFVYGGSSGGSFASIVARALPVKAQIIQISPGVESALMTASTRSVKQPINQPIHQSINPYALQSTDSLYPVSPTLFVYMSRDVNWASEARINSIAQKLKNAGRRIGPRLAKSDSVMIHRANPIAINKEFLFERVDDITLDDSDAFFRALHRDAFIDRYGFLIDDPRHSHVVGYLIDLFKPDQSTNLFQMMSSKRAEIEEMMNVAWAEHEFTSAHCDQIVWWMLAQAK